MSPEVKAINEGIVSKAKNIDETIKTNFVLFILLRTKRSIKKSKRATKNLAMEKSKFPSFK
jgi:hypothetical protein